MTGGAGSNEWMCDWFQPVTSLHARVTGTPTMFLPHRFAYQTMATQTSLSEMVSNGHILNVNKAVNVPVSLSLAMETVKA